MLNANRCIHRQQRGTTMLEVLVAIVIVVFGLLGLAGLQMRIQTGQMESYQRAQAIVLLSDMVERLNTNRSTAATYVTGTVSPLGVGDTQPTTCSSLAMGSARDQCGWSNALKGAAEQNASVNSGAMIGARGCIEQLQAPNPTVGVCAPGVYRVTVVWQGLNETVAPALICGPASFYGTARLQRAVSTTVTVGLPQCV